MLNFTENKAKIIILFITFKNVILHASISANMRPIKPPTEAVCS